MGDLEKKIGYTFRDPRLLETALTHSSYANEKHEGDCESYERLEFLGDSILGFTAAEFLYAHEPALPEDPDSGAEPEGSADPQDYEQTM